MKLCLITKHSSSLSRSVGTISSCSPALLPSCHRGWRFGCSELCVLDTARRSIHLFLWKSHGASVACIHALPFNTVIHVALAAKLNSSLTFTRIALLELYTPW